MTTATLKQKIRLDDGRTGYQVTHGGKLHEVVVTRTADGRKCRDVYCRRPDAMARVFSLADIGCEWTLAE